VRPLARDLQEQGYAIGVVTSVPISHATPACAYANNVTRDDYQDLSRDLLGLPSVSHPRAPLEGVDVLIGGGFGDLLKPADLVKQVEGQGLNFEPGNLWLSEPDLDSASVENGGRYVVATRTAGVPGREALQQAASRAVAQQSRLLGFFGNGPYSGHLPFRTADGNYDPAPGKNGKAEQYSPADLIENPTLSDMTSVALDVLSRNPRGFWLMVEAGDVDWANHENNLDNAIGAVLSGDAAVKVVTDWVETHSNWRETLLIVSADHGHYLVLDRPELLIDN
jgi:alkaline phosphatase